MLYNDNSSTRETLLIPYRYRYDRQCASKESQMSRRESDGRIVLLKVGNATGGKARGGEMGKSSTTTYYNIFKETLSVLRDRRNNGNEIRENT
jgi:hypothetical protein